MINKINNLVETDPILFIVMCTTLGALVGAIAALVWR